MHCAPVHLPSGQRPVKRQHVIMRCDNRLSWCLFLLRFAFHLRAPFCRRSLMRREDGFYSGACGESWWRVRCAVRGHRFSRNPRRWSAYARDLGAVVCCQGRSSRFGFETKGLRYQVHAQKRTAAEEQSKHVHPRSFVRISTQEKRAKMSVLRQWKEPGKWRYMLIWLDLRQVEIRKLWLSPCKTIVWRIACTCSCAPSRRSESAMDIKNVVNGTETCGVLCTYPASKHFIQFVPTGKNAVIRSLFVSLFHRLSSRSPSPSLPLTFSPPPSLSLSLPFLSSLLSPFIFPPIISFTPLSSFFSLPCALALFSLFSLFVLQSPFSIHPFLAHSLKLVQWK